MIYLKQLHDCLLRREEAWEKLRALEAESNAVNERRLSHYERSEIMDAIEGRKRKASIEWDDAHRAVEDCVDVNEGSELLAELKLLLGVAFPPVDSKQAVNQRAYDA